MPLKKKRSVIIRNPRLRRFRNNVRSVVTQACIAEQERILEEEGKIKTNPDYYKNHPPELLKQAKVLNDQYWAIE